MGANEPSPKTTLAIFIGASSFQYALNLAQGKPFYNSAIDFRSYLTSLDGLGVPEENICWLFDDTRSPDNQLQDIGTFIERRSSDLKNRATPALDLIFYYVGHGLFAWPNNQYCLAVRTTKMEDNQEGLSSIRTSDLAALLNGRGRFLRKILILDCCFAGEANKEFLSPALDVSLAQLRHELPGRGTTLFCAASSKDPAIAPVGSSRTMFTDTLLEALNEGHPFLGPRLSISELGALVREMLKTKYERWSRPEVHSPDQKEGMLRLCIFSQIRRV